MLNSRGHYLGSYVEFKRVKVSGVMLGSGGQGLGSAMSSSRSHHVP